MRESVWRSARRGVSSKHELAAEEKDAEIAPETARLGEEDAGLGEGLEAALGLAGAGTGFSYAPIVSGCVRVCMRAGAELDFRGPGLCALRTTRGRGVLG